MAENEAPSAPVSADSDVSSRSTAPEPLKALYRRARWTHRRATSRLRVLPNAVIIGAQKSGTTSLFSYLGSNPATLPASTKEVHYFDLRFERGAGWYKAHFATGREVAHTRARLGAEPVVFESSPYYLAHPLVPERMRHALPGARLIVLLRDPVQRAISHYHHAITRGNERFPLEQALALESERLSGEVNRLTEDRSAYSASHQRLSYLSRGHYANQLALWFALFDRDQFFIADSAELFSSPDRLMNRLCDFLEIPPRSLRIYRAEGAGDYPATDPGVIARLEAYFAPHNDRLYALIGSDLGWATRGTSHALPTPADFRNIV